MTDTPISIVVVGSVNLDIVASVSRLPLPGETVTDASLERFPGGKGANQALAAKRLGANVSLIACVGNDANADEALALLREGGVNLSACDRVSGESTGIALISVAEDGENQIVVAPGANRALNQDKLALPAADALICQLEVPVDVLDAAAKQFDGLFCINLAPARDVPGELLTRADVIVVNELEAAFYGAEFEKTDAIVVTTLGARGAVARRQDKALSESTSPQVDTVDSVGAGDTFTAALTVALASGREIGDALEFACSAAALATTKGGAQPSLPLLSEVEALMH